jgi:hypothetical protein
LNRWAIFTVDLRTASVSGLSPKCRQTEQTGAEEKNRCWFWNRHRSRSQHDVVDCRIEG